MIPTGEGYTLRPIAGADLPFLRRLYASTREEELAGVDWPAAQREAFLDQQFAAQHQWYQEQYEGATFDVVEVGGRPAGRLYVARWESELLDWTRQRGSTVVAVGGDVPDATETLRYAHDDVDDVRLLSETLVGELISAHAWLESAGG